MLLIIANNGVDIPFQDEFDTPFKEILKGRLGDLKAGDLVRQYNESRKLIPTVFFLALFHLFGYWNIQFQLYFTWAFGVAIVIALSALVGQTANRQYPGYPWLSLVTLFCMSAMIFSLSSYYRWLWGITLHRLIPGFCLILSALVFTLRWHNLTKALVMAGCATIALFSFSGGIIISVVNLVSICCLGGNKIKPIIVYIICLAIAYFNFFTDYHLPIKTQENIGLILLPRLRFSLEFLGNPFTSDYTLAGAIGLFLCGLFFMTIGYCFVLKPCDRRFLVPWIMIGAGSMIDAGFTSLRRAHIYPDSSLDLRYIFHANYLTIALLGLALVVITHPHRSLRSASLFPHQCPRLALFVFPYLLLGYAFVHYNLKIYPDIHYHKYRLLQGKACFQLISYLENDTCLNTIFHDPNSLRYLKDISRPIRRFSILKPGIFHVDNYTDFRSKLAMTPTAIGQIEGVTPAKISADVDQSIVSGFALLPNQGRPADAIVVVDAVRSQAMNQLVIVTVGKSGLRRPDLNQRLGSRYRYAGWSVDLSTPPSALTPFEFLAFDAQQNQFFRIQDTASP
ncbi:hypothetical protein [Trichothermofontia sp.]